MPRSHQSVADALNWLSFPPQAYPNFYLNVERIRHRFRGYLGSIRDFSRSAEKDLNVNAKVNVLFGEAGVGGGANMQAEIAWDLTDPLAQVLVLRAYLSTVGELHLDARNAPMTDFVLARGAGAIIEPSRIVDRAEWGDAAPNPSISAEVAIEHDRQQGMSGFDTPARYWAAFANTEECPVVSLLAETSLIGSDIRSYGGLGMTYCIFGQKIRDWETWTLLSPLHVWVEPPGRDKWG